MDLATVAAAVLRPGAQLALRDERITISLRLVGSLLDGRARIADISPDLAREIRAADGNGLATLILPAGPGPARIDLSGRQFALPPTLRETLLSLLNGGSASNNSPAATNSRASAATSTLAAESKSAMQLPTQTLVAAVTAESAATTSAAANALGASGALRSARNEARSEPGPAVRFEAPVFDPRAPAASAERLAARVSGSGVFFEAHVAQWARGERGGAAVQSEAQQVARALLADPAAADARADAQIDALYRHTITLSGPAWAGQPMRLELGRDPQVAPDAAAAGQGGAEPVFVARLNLDLPRLGSVEIRLRLAGESIAAVIASHASAEELAQALPEFAAALTARGLRPVLLQMTEANGQGQ
jgi:hypothetical protein